MSPTPTHLLLTRSSLAGVNDQSLSPQGLFLSFCAPPNRPLLITTLNSPTNPHLPLSPLSRRLNGEPFTPQRLDYGSTYASKFERLKDGRVIINTWVMESFVGCIDSCSDHTSEANDYLKK